MLVISLMLVVVYVVLATIKLGHWPESFTQLVSLPSKPWCAAWFLVCSVATILAAPAAFEATADSTQFLVFITLGASLAYGITPIMQADAEISTMSGYIAVCSCQAMIMLNCPWLLLTWVPLGYFVVTNKLSRWLLVVPAMSIVQFYAYCLIM